MYSLEMCHKSTTQESERGQRNTKEKKKPANTLFTHANVIRRYIGVAGGANMKKHFYCSTKIV